MSRGFPAQKPAAAVTDPVFRWFYLLFNARWPRSALDKKGAGRHLILQCVAGAWRRLVTWWPVVIEKRRIGVAP